MDPGNEGIEFRLLGNLELAAETGRVVEIGSAKQRLLLACLVLRLNKVVTVESLVDELWGDTPPPTVQVTLQSLVSRLRRALETAGSAPGASPPRLRNLDGGYVLEAAAPRVDAVRFEGLAIAGRRALARGDFASAAHALDEALRLWRGPALGDLADRPFARGAAQRLEETRLGAVEDLAEALLAVGRPQDALDRLDGHVTEHPLRERPWGQSMLGLYRVGRQADALATFRQLRRTLAEEIGVEPVPELRRLAERILHQDPDLVSSADPLTVQTPPEQHNLPVPLTSFVGRERELDEVVPLLASARLLTLTGPGGSGKTRMALQAAAAVLARFPDGVWFVELAPVSEPGLVAEQVATGLRLLPGALTRPDQTLQQGLCDRLRPRRLLLVLDNCEHVVEGAAALAHAVLTRCPDVAVLATSRELLGVPGEVVWTVPPLALPDADVADVAELAGCDAVALFCERARAAQAGFALSAANTAAVTRICRRLDGIPLALELAAGKTRVLGAHQVAERLDDRFRLLTGGARTVVPRHQTLRAAMDWSYDLLPAPEQAVLRRLAVFRGTFTLDAAEAVVGQVAPDRAYVMGPDVLGPLTRLVDKSLVSVTSDEPVIRYGLLETVREYAGQQLAEAGEEDEARTRHRDHFVGLAKSWATASDYWNWGLWLRRLVAERDDFAAALEWSQAREDDDALLHLAAAHWPYWYWGETLGWRRWLVEAVERCTTPSPARVEALIALASLLQRAGEEPTRCEALFAEASDVARGLPGAQSGAQVDFYRAHCLLSVGRRREARPLLRGALGRSVNADFLAWCHWGLGWIALHEDDVEAAAAEFGAALELGESVDDDSARAHMCSALALVAALRKDPAAAAAMASRAVRSAERMVGAPQVLMMALARAGQATSLSDAGAAGTTGAVVSRLLRMQRDMGVTHWVDEALAMAGLVLAARCPEEAAVALCAARTIDGGDGRLPAMRESLLRCRAGLVETLGPDEWAAAARRAQATPVHQVIVRALAALDAG